MEKKHDIAAPHHRRRFSRLLTAMKLCVGLAIIGVILNRVDTGQAFEQLLHVAVLPLAFAFGVKVIGLGLGVMRWRSLLRSRKIEVPALELTRVVMCADVINLVLPSGMGGDVYRVFRVRSSTASLLQSAGLVIFERYTGFLASCIMAVIAVMASDFPTRFPTLSIIVTALLVAALVPFAFAANRTLVRQTAKLGLWFGSRRITKLFIRVTRAIHSFARSPRLLLQLCTLSILMKVCIAFQYYFLGRALGLEVNAAAICIFMPLLVIVCALPISIAGLGVREGNTVFYFTFLGFSVDDATALSMLMLAWLYVSALPFCLALFIGPRSRHSNNEVGIDGTSAEITPT